MTQQKSNWPFIIWLIALFLAGATLLLPLIQIHDQLATGDNGRDLYAFAHAFDGAQSQVPFRDYWWCYGPLMPYYYGLWMKLCGVNILSVLLGKIFLLLLAGTCIGLTVKTLTSPIAGFAAAVWFWISFPDFLHTYNHTGGITCLSALGFFVVAHLQTKKKIYLWSALSSLLLLAFIKLTMGAVLLVMTVLAVLLAGLMEKKPFDHGRKTFYLLALISIPLIIITIHWLLFHGLTYDEIIQCFPVQNNYRQSIVSPWQSIILGWGYFTANWTLNSANKIISILVCVAAVRTIWLSLQNKLENTKILALALTTLLLLSIATLHEYIFSGIDYCLIWAIPLWIAFIFILIGIATENLKPMWKAFLWGSLLVIFTSEAARCFVFSNQFRTAEHFLGDPRGQVYLRNDSNWLSTVRKTTEFLEKNLQPKETFFALPYDPIYYYLTGRLSPTRMLIFFSHINIPPEQEKKTIMDLEKKHVNWVVLSNRSSSTETGLGVFGQDYGPLLAKYIEENFTLVVRIGEWEKPAGWAWDHGTAILRRKTGDTNK